jgi:hypothetical protein
MSHCVIQYAEDGQVQAVSNHASEAQAAAKLAAMEKNGQKGVHLPFLQPVGDISLLVWEEERGRLTKRAETLAELRAPLLAAVKQLQGQAAQADIETSEGVAQGDGRSQSVIMTFAMRIRAGEASPHGGVWRMRDNALVAFGDDDVLALDAALTLRNGLCQRRAWTLAETIRTETDPAILKTYDVAARWAAASEA